MSDDWKKAWGERQAQASFAKIVAVGNRFRSSFDEVPSVIVCKDGFNMSVIAGRGTYCSGPRDGDGYTAVEVGYPSERPEPWADWEAHMQLGPGGKRPVPTEAVYGWVPVATVAALIEAHGGEA